jgi:steroid delta-isomerase-like uncharacterized protein
MSIESTNKASIRRGFEVGINQRKLDVFEEVIDARYRNHTFAAPAPGAAGFKQVIAMFVDAFPDMEITLHDTIAEGDRVATRGSWRGTHRGAFMGIPATGKAVTVNYMDFWRLENGKAVENWVQMDLLGLMQQLGVVPAPGG